MRETERKMQPKKKPQMGMQSLNLEFRHVQMCKFVVFLRTIINHLYLYRSHQLKST